MTVKKKIWAFGSGKGGTGKSLVSANVGAYLAGLGLKVLLIDVDLGAANLHTCLGLAPPEVSLSDFINRKIETIEETVVATGIPNLSLISGARDSFNIAKIRYQQKRKLIREFKRLQYDLIILDIGSGTSMTMLEFFEAGQQGVFVMVPEPTSIENLYSMLNNLFFQRVRKFKGKTQVGKIVAQALEPGHNSGPMMPHELLAEIDEVSADKGEEIRKYMSRFRPGIVINQVRAEQDRTLGPSIRSVARRHFGIEPELLGLIEYDEAVWQAVRKRKLLINEYPHSRSARAIRQVADNLLHLSRKA